MPAASGAPITVFPPTTTISTEWSAHVRSRTSTDETYLAHLTYARVPPTSCAFAPDGKTFAFAGEKHVAIYELGADRPIRAIPAPNAGRLAWPITR